MTPDDWAAEGLYQGDCRDLLREQEADSVDACVTDPPYGIGFMGRKWDTFRPGDEQRHVVPNREADSVNPNLRGRSRAPAASPSAVEYDRSLAGQRLFQDWTASWAAEVYRVLKPGAHCVVFGAPRSHHRMMSGLEDAGFEIRDCLMWLFGQGFPKSLNVQQAINKAARGFPQGGADPTSPNHGKFKGGCTEESPDGRGFGAGAGAFMAEAGTGRGGDQGPWQGWGTALKPAWEPIVLARKPLAQTVAANVLEYGTGAINIDGCRVGDPRALRDLEVGTPAARWPASVILDEAAGAILDQQAGERTSGERRTSVRRGTDKSRLVYGTYNDAGTQAYPADVPASAGGASRFFYCPKVSTWEREFGCDRLPMRTPGAMTGGRAEGSAGLNNPRAGAGRTSGSRNAHPTVKPIALMQWLVTLVTPPRGIILDPFVGSGPTAIAADLGGYGFFGSDLEAEWLAVAHARVLAWRARGASGV